MLIIMYDNTSPAPVSAQIRALRTARGLTLAELATRAGTSAPTVHRYESGWDRFEMGTLRKIATALGARLEIRLRADLEEAEREPTVQELLDLWRPLFWDRDLIASDLEEYRVWVLSRVLMFGDRRQVAAARRFFGDDAIREAIARREVDPRTRNYWNFILSEPDAPESS